LGNEAVFEFRHNSWWDYKEEIRDTGAVFCSVDAPNLPRDIIPMNDAVYLRLHGRKNWYSWIYTDAELEKIAEEIRKINTAKRRFIYLNNDHGMLPNTRFLIRKLCDSSEIGEKIDTLSDEK
jgi:uncharacterized protein YecE (DUF72 family)